MRSTTKYHRSIPLIVIVCVLVAIKSASSAPGTQTKDGNLHRTSQQQDHNGSAKAATTKRAAVAPTSDLSQTKEVLPGNRKFQARMGGDQQQASQMAPVVQPDPYYLGADSWSPHSLVPTFTDQEQGDEMVALASDPADQVEGNYNKAAQNRTSAESKYSDARFGSDTGNDRPSPMSSKHQRPQPADEYYPDDEEEEELESFKGMRAELESSLAGSMDRKERPSSKAPKMMQQDENSQYMDEPGQRDLFEQGPPPPMSRNIEPIVNASKQSSAAEGTRWTSRELNFGNQASQVPIAGPQQQFLNEPKPREVAPIAAPATQTSAEKLTSFFAGRDALSPFSKTDAAIEYLRNLLKTKQNARNNSTFDAAAGSAPEMGQQNNKPEAAASSSNDKSSGLRGFSSIASKISQMLSNNNSTPSVALGSYEQSNSSKFDYSPLPPTGNVRASSFESGQSDGKFVAIRQQQPVDGTKFSIVDAKPTPTVGFYMQSTPTTNPSSTTKLPPQADERNKAAAAAAAKQLESIFMDSSSMAEPIKPEPYSQDPSQQPNGTPLGGDYIESLDDFPRGSMRPHQHFMSSAAESRLVPVIQQDPEQHQSSEQQPTPTSAALVDQIVNQSKESQQAPKHQQPPTPAATGGQITPLHFDRQAFEAFQRQLSGVPSSSKYFQFPKTAAETQPDHQKQQQQQQQVRQATSFFEQPAKEPARAVHGPRQSLQPSAYMSHQQVANQTIEQHPALRKDPRGLEESKRRQQHEQSSLVQSFLEQHSKQQQQLHQPNKPPSQQPQQQQISSKIYPQEQTFSSHFAANQKQQQQQQQHSSNKQHAPFGPEVASSSPAAETSQQKVKPPKIVSYNYFESPSETGESELMTTNYQLGDTLYSSNGGVEQILSNSELEAIQNQFLTVEHPVVPIGPGAADSSAAGKQQVSGDQDQSLTGLLANLKPNLRPDLLQKLHAPSRQAEEVMKELASNEEQVSVVAPSPFNQANLREQTNVHDMRRPMQQQQQQQPANVAPMDAKKKKSLIVYLNHPRPVDMSKVASHEEGYSLTQSIGDPQSAEPYISAKEFDIHGLSSNTKQLDVGGIRELNDLGLKEQDKDGLSVVVIGDAYKYKKIVLLISSKSGGLKFIPMVKDMRK